LYFVYHVNKKHGNHLETLSAVSATLKTRDDSLNRRFSVGTKPSKKILIPVTKTDKVNFTTTDRILAHS